MHITSCFARVVSSTLLYHSGYFRHPRFFCSSSVRSFLHAELLTLPSFSSSFMSAHPQPTGKSVNPSWWHVVIEPALTPSCISGWATLLYSRSFQQGGCLNLWFRYAFPLSEYLRCTIMSNCDHDLGNEGVSSYLRQNGTAKRCCLSWWCVGGSLVCTNCSKRMSPVALHLTSSLRSHIVYIPAVFNTALLTK